MTDGTYNVLFRPCVGLSVPVVFCQFGGVDFGGGSFLFFTIVTDYVVQHFFMVGITSPESIAVFIAQAGSAVPPAEIVINRDGLVCIPRGGLFANDVSFAAFCRVCHRRNNWLRRHRRESAGFAVYPFQTGGRRPWQFW